MGPVIPVPDLDATGRGVPGDHPEYVAEPGRTVRLLAEALGRLHGTAAPSGQDVLDRCEVAAALTRELADVTDDVRVEDPAYRHVTVALLLGALHDGADPSRDGPPVRTHGRPTLGSLRVDDGALVGLVDWDDAAVAPAARDVSIALRSLIAAFGPGVAPAFAASYPGVMPSVEQVDWWVLAAVLGDLARPGTAPS